MTSQKLYGISVSCEEWRESWDLDIGPNYVCPKLFRTVEKAKEYICIVLDDLEKEYGKYESKEETEDGYILTYQIDSEVYVDIKEFVLD